MGKILIICTFLALQLLLSGCFEKAKETSSKKINDTVYVAHPSRQYVEIWDDYTARLEGEKSVEIRARVNGYLEKILFKDGDYVNEGDVLFEIDSAPFKAVVDACRADVAGISAKVELASNNLERARQLYEGKAVSKEVLETRKSELLSAKAVKMSADAKLSEAMLNLKFTKILAPISGYIGKRNVDVGNLVSSADTLLATIVSRDTIYAYFQISERDVIRYDKINLFKTIDTQKRQGPPVRLKLMDESEFSHSGVLTYVDNTLNAASIELRADIDNRGGRLFPGMFAKLSLRAGKPVEKILVPELAVGTDLIGRYVLIVNEENIVEYRAVKIGEKIGKMVIIEEGLDGSERVICKGIQRARPDAKVTPMPLDSSLPSTQKTSDSEEQTAKVSTKNTPNGNKNAGEMQAKK